MLYVFFTAHSAIFIGGLQNFLSKKKVFLRIYSHLCYASSLVFLSASATPRQENYSGTASCQPTFTTQKRH